MINEWLSVAKAVTKAAQSPKASPLRWSPPREYSGDGYAPPPGGGVLGGALPVVPDVPPPAPQGFPPVPSPSVVGRDGYVYIDGEPHVPHAAHVVAVQRAYYAGAAATKGVAYREGVRDEIARRTSEPHGSPVALWILAGLAGLATLATISVKAWRAMHALNRVPTFGSVTPARRRRPALQRRVCIRVDGTVKCGEIAEEDERAT